MKALVYCGERDIRYTDTDDPSLNLDTDVIVRVTSTAICGSDLHLWHGGMPTEPGFAVGHEFLGIVEEVGSDVRHFGKGDRVLASCTIGCGDCGMCRVGMYSGCSTQAAAGATASVFGFGSELPGGQAEGVRVPYADSTLFGVPESLSDEQALFLTDILPTGYMGAEFAEVAPGDTVVVFGCGPVGTFAQMSAQLRGAARVIAVDLDDERLELAAKRGCETVNPSQANLGELVLEWTNGLGADCAIEAVGRADLITEAATVTRVGGRVAVIGVLTDPMANLPWMLFFMKNLTIRTGLVNPQNYIPKLMALIEQGRLDPTAIISHRLPLAKGAHGYEIFSEHRERAMKVVMTP